MALRVVEAIRYILPLREGGSLPVLCEAADGRQYVVKLRGAGQGPLALAAEILTGEIARSLELPVPEIVLVQLDEAFGRTELDPEIQDLFKASRGLNVGLEFLSEATVFDPASGDVADVPVASRTVWLDAYCLNVDRTARNANLLTSRSKLWLIDHGASLYFHHNWSSAGSKAATPFSAIKDHILLRWARQMAEAGALARNKLAPEVLEFIVDLVPEEWLVRPGEEPTPAERRAAYLRFFTQRLAAAHVFEEEIARAQG